MFASRKSLAATAIRSASSSKKPAFGSATASAGGTFISTDLRQDEKHCQDEQPAWPILRKVANCSSLNFGERHCVPLGCGDEFLPDARSSEPARERQFAPGRGRCRPR